MFATTWALVSLRYLSEQQPAQRRHLLRQLRVQAHHMRGGLHELQRRAGQRQVRACACYALQGET
jgi:hypothetical protein